jgi:hypothetical protein
MQTQKIPALTHAALATIVLCIATVGYTYHMPEFGRFFTGINEFLPHYTQARLAFSPAQYDIEAGYREQESVAGFHIVGAYHDRLPWQSLMMAPLGWLPYNAAYWVWVSLNLLAFAGLVIIWLAPRDFVLWGAAFLPAAACFIRQQDTLMLALCLAGALRLAAKRHDFAAGLVLALCTAKPHLFVLVPLALLAHRRWKIIYGATIGTLGLLLLGTVTAGWDWPARLWTVLEVLGRHTGLDMARRPSVFQFAMSPWTIALAAMVVVGFGTLVWRTRSLEAGIALATLGSILIAPHAAIYDLPLLLVVLPALPLSGWRNRFRLLLFSPLPYWALLNDAPWSTLTLIALMGAALACWPEGVPAELRYSAEERLVET